MKNKLLILCICITSISFIKAQQKTGSVHIKGILKGFNNQVEVEDMSELQYLLPPVADRMTVPDANGNFEISFQLASPNYFRLGRNALYLSPGDNMEVFINKADPRVATFAGKGAEANLFLRNTPFPKGGSYIEAGGKTQRTPQATIDLMIKTGEQRSRELDSVKNVSAEFKRLEQGRIRADIINSLEMGKVEFYRPRKMPKDSLAMYAAEYEKLIQPLVDSYSKGFTDASLMKLVVYRDHAEDLVKEPGKTKDILQMKDWIKSTSLTEQMKKVSDKNQLAPFHKKIDSVSTKSYHEALTRSLSNLLQFGKGDVAVDFTVKDISGKDVKLSSLKGKVIYIDVWATWCGPCMAEMPNYESLKAKYKNNPDIAFVSLSVDDGAAEWQKSVTERKVDGYQWQVNRTKLTAYNIVTIPRMFLIGKDFKMADMDAPLPSSKQIEKTINDLLQ